MAPKGFYPYQKLEAKTSIQPAFPGFANLVNLNDFVILLFQPKLVCLEVSVSIDKFSVNCSCLDEVKAMFCDVVLINVGILRLRSKYVFVILFISTLMI